MRRWESRVKVRQAADNSGGVSPGEHRPRSPKATSVHMNPYATSPSVNFGSGRAQICARHPTVRRYPSPLNQVFFTIKPQEGILDQFALDLIPHLRICPYHQHDGAAIYKGKKKLESAGFVVKYVNSTEFNLAKCDDTTGVSACEGQNSYHLMNMNAAASFLKQPILPPRRIYSSTPRSFLMWTTFISTRIGRRNLLGEERRLWPRWYTGKRSGGHRVKGRKVGMAGRRGGTMDCVET
ncbi:hypothetical protein FB567DRAFT_583119 [Paraphoma chrysanthemicola]|uniref:Uncharacterized protein n=1 Tax=Paraphoma chrysanthemicola TaxID=798071 RepID=A0A8K0QXX8_9PLEO|nr:hypothetical protein FB567DRAFT_583119 [Paraphoma chrysanthemicola]